MTWALNAYERWRKYREEIYRSLYTTKTNNFTRAIKPLHEVAKDIEQLKMDVCDFIVEIRKENGEQYPPGSLYDLLGGLSIYLQREHGFEDKLMSTAFREIRNTLDHVMKERTQEGIVGNEERDVITDEHEDILWKKGVLGESNPNQLRKTIFFLAGLRFGMRGIKEHHDMRRYPQCNINIIKIQGKDALIYREFYSKTNQGGINQRHVRAPKIGYAFCSGFRPRCFVELFRKFQFVSPRGSYYFPKFYQQTNNEWSPGGDNWYLPNPVGKNTIGKYLEEIMAAGGIPGNWKNHCLRKACASRLFRKGVDPQLIAEQTGHKSNAIMLYKKTSLDLKKKVSDLLTVLPKESEDSGDDFLPQQIFNTKTRAQKEKEKLEEMASEKPVNKAPPSTDTSKVPTPKTESKSSENKEIKPAINDSKPTPIDVHVPINGANLSNLASLQGMVNIHFHIYQK